MRFLLLVIISLVANFQVSQACSASSIATGLAKENALASTVNGYGATDVKSHVEGQLSQISYGAKDGEGTLYCVDARADSPVVGTPGGDLAEFAAGIFVYMNMTSTTPTAENVQQLLKEFIAAKITTSRPFYYHTDDTRVNRAYTNIGTRLSQAKPTTMPVNGPPAADKAVRIDELSQSYAQGCGHLRLMINDSTASQYGLPSNAVPRFVIQALYQEFWAASAADKAKYLLVTKLGPLVRKAIAIVTNKGPGCHQDILLIFVYSPNAATAFRKNVLTDFFVKKSSNLNAEAFNTQLNALLTTQLGATLTLLDPANKINLISVDVTTASNSASSAALQFGSFSCIALALFSLFSF
jgi:hypothetical protein